MVIWSLRLGQGPGQVSMSRIQTVIRKANPILVVYPHLLLPERVRTRTVLRLQHPYELQSRRLRLGPRKVQLSVPTRRVAQGLARLQAGTLLPRALQPARAQISRDNEETEAAERLGKRKRYHVCDSDEDDSMSE